MAKKYLNVAYKDRDLAKRLGARWDAGVGRWYCPSGSPLAKIFGWRAEAVAKSETVKSVETASRRPAMNQNFELPLAG